MEKNKPKIAILGATGNIGKSLTYQFFKRKNFEILYLFNRNSQKLSEFYDEELFLQTDLDYKTIFVKNNSEWIDYEFLNDEEYDIIINCVGVGTNPENYSDYFTVNEYYDNLILNYLQEHKETETLYISLSSGAIYGDLKNCYADKNTTNQIQVNSIEKENYYSIVRLYLESKHRSFKDLNIVDLRLFNFFFTYRLA